MTNSLSEILSVDAYHRNVCQLTKI